MMGDDFFIFPLARTAMQGLSGKHPPFADTLPSQSGNLRDRYAALHAEVDRVLIASPRVPIMARETLRQESGVYAIFHQGSLAYIGSTHAIRGRLAKHAQTIKQADAIDAFAVSYVVAYCGKHDAKGAEGALIDHYAPPWNSMGFGSNAAGRGRKNQRDSRWNLAFGRSAPADGGMLHV
jgi:hypothetical protein